MLVPIVWVTACACPNSRHAVGPWAAEPRQPWLPLTGEPLFPLLLSCSPSFYPCSQPTQSCLFCHFNETAWLTEGSDGWQGVKGCEHVVGKLLEEGESKREQCLALCFGKVVRSSQPPPELHLTHPGMGLTTPASSCPLLPLARRVTGWQSLQSCVPMPPPSASGSKGAPFQGACPGFPATLPTSCLSPWAQQQPDTFFSSLKLGAGAASSLLSLLVLGGAYSLQTLSARLSPESALGLT